MYDVARPAPGNPMEETGRMPVLFTGDRPAAPPPPRRGPDYDGIQHSREFVSLRRRFRAFVFPMSFVFFAWYMTYVLLAAYAHDFMSQKVFGQVNMAMLLGIGQFASTALLTWVYVRFARRHLDPKVAELRERTAAAGGGAR